MPWWRLLGTAVSQWVWSICVCVILCICVCVCHVFSTLWDKYLFSSSQFRAHLPTGDKKKKKKHCQNKINVLHVNALSACESMRWKTLNEILLPSITCLRMRKSLPHTCQSLLRTQVSAGQMLIQRGFSAPCPLSLHWGFARPEHGLSVTCPGRAASWDLLSISSLGGFIWDNTDGRTSQD